MKITILAIVSVFLINLFRSLVKENDYLNGGLVMAFVLAIIVVLIGAL